MITLYNIKNSLANYLRITKEAILVAKATVRMIEQYNEQRRYKNRFSQGWKENQKNEERSEEHFDEKRRFFGPGM